GSDPKIEFVRNVFGGRLTGLLADDLARTVAVIDDASESDLGEALANWARRRFLEKKSDPLPFVLTRRSWNLWGSLPYQDHPAPALEARRERIRRAGFVAPGARIIAWGDLPAPTTADPT